MYLVSPALNLPRGSERHWWLKFLCLRVCCNIQDRENLSHVFEMWKNLCFKCVEGQKSQVH